MYLDIKQKNKKINSYTDKRLNTFLTFELEEEYKDLITSLDIKYFSLVDIFCKNYLCSRYVKIDNVYYVNFVDRIHLSFSGSKFAGREIVKLFNWKLFLIAYKVNLNYGATMIVFLNYDL